MNRISSLLSVMFLFASCAPVQIATRTPRPTATASSPVEPAFTSLPPNRTATNSPTTTPSSTPFPCDPFIAEFCITDGHFLLQRPIVAPGNEIVDRTYPYSSTADGTRDPHRGVEFVNELGTPVYAAGEGVVIFAGPDDMAIYSPWRVYYGNLVVLDHENDLFTLYAHLSKIVVEAGDTVKTGEKIGEVGRSGVAIGSHLHFEVRREDVEDYFSTENPELWLVPRPLLGAVSLSIINSNSTFQRAKITLQYYSAFDEVLDVYYLDTYHPSLAIGDENAAIGDLAVGKYRITLIYNGQIYERWVEVESSRLTEVVIVVK